MAGLALGSAHTCAWLRDGTARCWGANTGGQLGTGTTVNSPSPVPVVGLTGVVQMALGTHSCARRSDGTVRCWGFNHGGQLIYTQYSSPISKKGLSPGEILNLLKHAA